MILNQSVHVFSLGNFLKENNYMYYGTQPLLIVTCRVLNVGLKGWHNHSFPIFRLLLTLKSRSIVRLFSIPPHGKVVVGGCDDGCYVWKLFDGKSQKGDKR